MFGMHNLRVTISYGGHKNKIMLKREGLEKPQQNEVLGELRNIIQGFTLWIGHCYK